MFPATATQLAEAGVSNSSQVAVHVAFTELGCDTQADVDELADNNELKDKLTDLPPEVLHVLFAGDKLRSPILTPAFLAERCHLPGTTALLALTGVGTKTVEELTELAVTDVVRIIGAVTNTVSALSAYASLHPDFRPLDADVLRPALTTATAACAAVNIADVIDTLVDFLLNKHAVYELADLKRLDLASFLTVINDGVAAVGDDAFQVALQLYTSLHVPTEHESPLLLPSALRSVGSTVALANAFVKRCHARGIVTECDFASSPVSELLSLAESTGGAVEETLQFIISLHAALTPVADPSDCLISSPLLEEHGMPRQVAWKFIVNCHRDGMFTASNIAAVTPTSMLERVASGGGSDEVAIQLFLWRHPHHIRLTPEFFRAAGVAQGSDGVAYTRTLRRAGINFAEQLRTMEPDELAAKGEIKLVHARKVAQFVHYIDETSTLDAPHDGAFEKTAPPSPSAPPPSASSLPDKLSLPTPSAPPAWDVPFALPQNDVAAVDVTTARDDPSVEHSPGKILLDVRQQTLAHSAVPRETSPSPGAPSATATDADTVNTAPTGSCPPMEVRADRAAGPQAPPSFFCPITRDLMRDPVTTVDGHS
jgi:hypothetical protein